MSKIGNVVDQHLEINRNSNVGDLGDSVSFLNNVWSSINNFQGGSNLETATSILLAFQDGLSIIEKIKSLEVVNGSD